MRFESSVSDPSFQRADTTLVVVPREQFSVALRSLDSILELTESPYELVYVDGNSPEPVRKGIEERARRHGFRLLRSDHYLSPNRARNIGLREVETPFVVFLDNDLLVSRGWLSSLRERSLRTGAWIVGPLYLEGDSNDRVIHMAGGRYEFTGDGPPYEFTTEHVLQHSRIGDLSAPLRAKPCDFVEFHCMFVRMSVFDRLGPLDERLLNTREHLDLCLAVHEAGGSVWLEPDAVVVYSAPPPIGLGDLRYFMTRWSESWTLRSLEHFVDKHEIESTYKKRVGIARARRRLIFDPLVTRTRRLVGRRPAGALAYALSCVEALMNRLLVRAPRAEDTKPVRRIAPYRGRDVSPL